MASILPSTLPHRSAPDVDREDNRLAELLTGCLPLFRRLAIDQAFDLEQRIDPLHHLDRDRRDHGGAFALRFSARIGFQIGQGEERPPGV